MLEFQWQGEEVQERQGEEVQDVVACLAVLLVRLLEF